MTKIVILFTLLSTPSFADTLEEYLMSGLDVEAKHHYKHNPALLESTKKSYSFLAMKADKDSSVTASPTGTRQNVSYTLDQDAMALSALSPFGGGAFGLSYTRLNSTLTTDNDLLSDVIRETKRDDIYALKFIINLTPTIDFGFHYQYKQAENNIYGSFFLDETDGTHYKAFLSAYRLGLKGKFGKSTLGVYTAPPSRGRAEIDGENKIVAEPGSGGFDFLFDLNDKTAIGVGGTRWFFRKDDRLEQSTSPIDGRNISLNGLDLDQYLAPLENYRLGVRYKFKSHIIFSGNVARQESVFHFNESGLPGDDRENIPSFRHLHYKLAAEIIKGRLSFTVFYRSVGRSQSTVTDRTFKLGHRDYIDYAVKESSILLLATFSS